MRIFFASDTSPNSALQSNLWRDNLYRPLVDLGHDVVEFQYDLRRTFQNLDRELPEQKAFIEKNRPVVTKELLRQIRAAHATKPVDLFFSYFYDACILPAAVDEIRSLGIKTVNWYCNASYQLHLVAEIAPHYDFCLVPEKFRLKDYMALGAHPIYCQEAANPTIYKAYSLPLEFDVTFVGRAYGERPAYVRYLVDQGIDVRVFGYDWERYSADKRSRYVHYTRLLAGKLGTPEGRRATLRRVSELLRGGHAPERPVALPSHILGGTLTDLEMVKIYSRSKINLGFSTVGTTHLSGQRITQVRLRDFEVPMSGGFYMVEYMAELEEFFNIGKEIVCYTGPEDLADKIKYYLRHENERETIRQAGHARCLRDHTWQKRLEMAFTQMGYSA